MSQLDAIQQDLVVGNRILANNAVVDVFGHLSARHPDRADRYLLSASRAPSDVSEADLIEFDHDNQPVDQNGRSMYAERPIHGSIYRARPDVMSICHNHSPATIPFGVTLEPLRPILHVGAVIGKHVPVWDTAEEFGDTDLLVVTRAMGDSLARSLGDGRVVLMRGHGAAVAGSSIRETVFISIYLQRNAEIVTAALAFGKTIRYLSDGEIDRASPFSSQKLAQDRAWSGWMNDLDSKK